MNVIVVPVQTVVPGFAAIVTVGVMDEVVCMISEFDTTSVVLKHMPVVFVNEMLHVIISPSASVELV